MIVNLTNCASIYVCLCVGNRWVLGMLRFPFCILLRYQVGLTPWEQRNVFLILHGLWIRNSFNVYTRWVF